MSLESVLLFGLYWEASLGLALVFFLGYDFGFAWEAKGKERELLGG